MKIKVIADITIIVGLACFFIWWVISIPFSDKELWTSGENLAAILSTWSMLSIVIFLAWIGIKWIHN